MARKKAAEDAPKVEHTLQMNVSDNSTSCWVTCSCGYESAFYTLGEGDGKEAMEAALAEARKHSEPPTPDEALATG